MHSTRWPTPHRSHDPTSPALPPIVMSVVTTRSRSALATVVACMTTATIDGHRAGPAEPVVLLHGIGTAKADFAALVPRLAEDFDVLALDLPGHGGSPPIDGPASVVALADAIERDLD